MKRGAVSKSTSRLLNVWVPVGLFPILDEGVRLTDLDRSKFIRAAIREKLVRHGIRTDISRKERVR
jgi:hypothetical protein